MAAIVSQRDTQEIQSSFTMVHEFLGADSHTFIKGGMVAINAAGRLVMASSTAGEIPCGRCEENFVTGAGNARLIKFKSGIFKWGNEATALVVAASLGRDCFVQDNATVRLNDDTSSIAGKVYRIDSDGVWVSQPFPLVIT